MLQIAASLGNAKASELSGPLKIRDDMEDDGKKKIVK